MPVLPLQNNLYKILTLYGSAGTFPNTPMQMLFQTYYYNYMFHNSAGPFYIVHLG